MSGKFEIFLGKNEQFYFRLKASNGEIILASQGYQAKANSLKGIASVKINAEIDDQFERKTTEKGNYRFNLRSRNGRVIGTSENYSSESARNKGIASVIKNAPTAKVIDLVES